jgi:hypothetical protein
VLPPEIGRLTGLKWIWLDGNQLTVLPPEIADLIDSAVSFSAKDNNWEEPIPELIMQGNHSLAAYLRSLRDGTAQ